MKGGVIRRDERYVDSGFPGRITKHARELDYMK
jgi:hypothetical protein